MNKPADANDIFETNITPKPADANIFNQKIKEFYQAPQPTIINNQAINQGPVNQSINKNKFHFRKKIAIITCLVIFLGALSAGAYYFLNQKVSAKELVNLMKANLVEAKSLHYIGQIILNNDFSLSLNFNGEVDEHDQQNKKSAVLIKALVSNGLMKMSPELELRTFGKDKYLRIKIENLPFIEQLSSLNNQWLMIDLEALKKFIPTNVNLNSDNQEKSSQINNLVKQTNFFINLAELDNEIINDKKNRHLTFELDKQELKNFFINLSTIYDNKLNAGQLTALDENLARAPIIKGEMWIDSEDYSLTKIIIPVTFEEGSEKFTLEIKFELSNYNVPANIAIPEQSKTLEEVQKIIEEQVSSYYDTSKASTLDSDYDGLTDEMEKIYVTNPNNSDTDGDGYNDGEEVQNGYDPTGNGKLDLTKYNLGSTKNKDSQRISDTRQLSTILDVEDAAMPNSILTGCNLSYSLTNICKSPGDVSMFSYYNDPSSIKIACTKNSQSSCNYSISRQDGTANPTTSNYQICFYLENSDISSYPDAKLGLNSIISGGIIRQGCN